MMPVGEPPRLVNVNDHAGPVSPTLPSPKSCWNSEMARDAGAQLTSTDNEAVCDAAIVAVCSAGAVHPSGTVGMVTGDAPGARPVKCAMPAAFVTTSIEPSTNT